MLSSRMQRMTMCLLNYDLHVVYIKGSHMYFADTLSRAHSIKTVPANLFDNEVSVAEIGIAKDCMQEIIQETKNDFHSELSRSTCAILDSGMLGASIKKLSKVRLVEGVISRP